MSTSSLTWWILRIFIVILIIDQVRNNIGFSDVDQKTVSNNDGSLKFGECSITFSKILDLVLSIKWVALDEKLAALVVVTTTHHGIHRWLVFASITVVWIVHWDDKVIHLLLKNLFTSCIFDVAASGTGSVV